MAHATIAFPIPDDPPREDTFVRLVAEHGHFLYRVAHGVLRNPHDAEDAVQDALLKLYRTHTWQGIDNERAFLARVVWRAAIDRFNARTQADPEAEFLLQDKRATPEAHVAAADERALLHELIDALSEDLRQTLLLSAMEELNSREVAAILNIPEGTVRTRLMRARAELKASYESRTGAKR